MELCPCHMALLLALDRSRKRSTRRCCTCVCMQGFASNRTENILSRTCDYKNYILITPKQKKMFWLLSQRSVPASMLAVMLTTLCVRFDTQFLYVCWLSNTLQVVIQLFEVALTPRSRCPFQCQMSTGLTQSPRSPRCGWVPQQSTFAAGADEENPRHSLL